MSIDRSSLTREIILPEGVSAQFTEDLLTITGPLGSTSKDFRLIRAKLNIDSNKIDIGYECGMTHHSAYGGAVYLDNYMSRGEKIKFINI